MNHDLYDHASEVELSGLRVCLARPRGSGTHRFMLLHGNPASMGLDFGALVNPLAQLGQVAAFDLPGLGRSPTPDRCGTLDIDRLADVTLAALDHLGWDKAVLVGHSHGGGVAQRVAARWPERVSGLVLLGTLGIPAHGYYRVFPLPGIDRIVGAGSWVLSRVPALWRPGLVRLFMDSSFAPQQATDAQVADYCAQLIERPHILRNMAWLACGKPCERLARDAHRITAPTLVMHGRIDPIVPIRHGRNISGLISSARFVELPGGHAIPSQEPDRVVSEIRALLA